MPECTQKTQMPPKKAAPDSGKSKQRPINAFFFQKSGRQDSTGSASTKHQQPPPQQQSRQASSKQSKDDSPEVELLEQPAKRARFFESDPAGEQPAAPEASQPLPATSAETLAPQTSAVPQHPAPRPGAHQRFQNKLVLGIGNRKAAGKDSIVPQKHTPLELQVVQLKKQHAGVLLAIEVRQALQQVQDLPSAAHMQVGATFSQCAGGLQVPLLW